MAADCRCLSLEYWRRSSFETESWLDGSVAVLVASENCSRYAACWNGHGGVLASVEPDGRFLVTVESLAGRSERLDRQTSCLDGCSTQWDSRYLCVM